MGYFPPMTERVNDDVIQIACSVDEHYALPLAVMLISLADRLSPPHRVQVRILHTDLSPATLDILTSFKDVTAHEIPREELSLLPTNKNFPLVAAAPLLLPQLLPDVGRVLFLDADLLVLADVEALWRHDLAGRALAAATDPAIPQCRSPRGVKQWRARGIPPHTPYFNAGVMLIDLDTWRLRQIAPQALAYLHEEGPATDFYHQQALNGIAWNDCSRLPQRWNTPASAGRGFGSAEPSDPDTPGIIHFSGRMKPWRLRTGSRYDAAYAAVLGSLATGLVRPATTHWERFLGIYDTTLRPAMLPLEHLLWKLRIT
jgi:lipopolysaccharide biosynthesis glycosyltransferase